MLMITSTFSFERRLGDVELTKTFSVFLQRLIFSDVKTRAARYRVYEKWDKVKEKNKGREREREKKERKKKKQRKFKC